MRVPCRCGRTLLVPDSLAGRQVSCPACRRVVPIPLPEPEGPRPFPLKRVSVIAGGVGAGLVLLTVIAEAPAVTVILTLLCMLLALQGLWMGGIRVAALLVGMLLSLVIAVPVGPVLAGLVRSLFGVPRLLSPMVGVAMVGMALIIAATVAAGPVTRRITRAHPIGRHLDRWVGLGLGAAEGLFLSLFVCWILAAIQPVAEAAARKVEQRGEEHPLARHVGRLAGDARRSLFGRAAERAIPVGNVKAVRLTAELAETLTDDAALSAFANDPAIEDLLDRPEVRSAVGRLRADEDLRRRIEERDLMGLLDNATVAEVVGDRDLRRLAVEHQDEILAALDRARKPGRQR